MRVCLVCGKPLTKYQKKYCSSQCTNDGKYQDFITKWKNGEEQGMRGEYNISRHIKRYLFEKYNYKCSKCGWGEMNPYSKLIPLEIEHIDGNYQNHKEENLTLLCPNCHSLTATYKGANKGNGRKSRKNMIYKILRIKNY